MNHVPASLKTLLLILVVGTTSCATTKTDPLFDQMWVGELVPYERPEERFYFALTLRRHTAYVWTHDIATGWTSSYSGKYRVSAHKTNAVIFVIRDGQTNGEPWVETWAMNTTLISNDKLLIQWSRVVNNTDTPPDVKDSKFSFTAKGILDRQTKD